MKECRDLDRNSNAHTTIVVWMEWLAECKWGTNLFNYCKGGIVHTCWAIKIGREQQPTRNWSLSMCMTFSPFTIAIVLRNKSQRGTGKSAVVIIITGALSAEILERKTEYKSALQDGLERHHRQHRQANKKERQLPRRRCTQRCRARVTTLVWKMIFNNLKQFHHNQFESKFR